jgi:hypothetical protein
MKWTYNTDLTYISPSFWIFNFWRYLTVIYILYCKPLIKGAGQISFSMYRCSITISPFYVNSQRNVINVLKTALFIETLVRLHDIVYRLHLLKFNLHLKALFDKVLSLNEYLTRYWEEIFLMVSTMIKVAWGIKNYEERICKICVPRFRVRVFFPFLPKIFCRVINI